MSEVTPEEMVEDIYYEVEDADVIPMPIDPTLSNPGEAADAKATGDAIRNVGANLKVNNVSAVDGVFHVYPVNIPMSGDEGAQKLSDVLNDIGGRTGSNILLSTGNITTIAEAVTDLEGQIEEISGEIGEYLTEDDIDVTLTEAGKVADAKAVGDAIQIVNNAAVKSVNNELPNADGNVNLNTVPYANDLLSVQNVRSTGEFIIRTAGGDASIEEEGEARLQIIGGNILHTGVVQEVLDMTVTPVAREEGVDPITATINADTFRAYVPASGTITLIYSTVWSADPALYGITVTGTPVGGDVITVVYVKADRGTITVANPTAFKSTGWNLYNHAAGYARVTKYSTQYGFRIGGTYQSVSFARTLNGERITVTPSSGLFTVPDDGYVFVTGGSSEDTYIINTWSDWINGYAGEFTAYSETEIDISNTMQTYFPNGLMRVGTVRDEIDLAGGNAYSRIERIAYTDQAMADIISSGRAYEADTNYIYAVKVAPDVYGVSISNTYTANDHGNEFFEQTAGVPVYIETLYGANLKNKLERDVVTKSTDLVNNGNCTETGKALDARFGKTLSDSVDALNSLITPQAHQVFFRGKNLGSSLTAAQKAAIQDGTFEDIFLGDYWTISGVTYRVADFDYWYNCGDTYFTSHHLIIVPDTPMYSYSMNDTNTTTGGYVGSKMYTTGLNEAKTAITAAFGDAVLTHREYLVNAVASGRPSGRGWFDSTVELMNENMVYGSKIFSAVSDGTTVPINFTLDKSQLALFRAVPRFMHNRQSFWLRDIVSGVMFALVYNDGRAFDSVASNSMGVRPVFAIG